MPPRVLASARLARASVPQGHRRAECAVTPDSIYTLADQLRDIVNSARVRTRLEESGEAFWQAASALDLLGDTELAIVAFQTPSATELSDGDLYLRMYGVLNAFVLQQDATQNLSKALGFPMVASDYNELSEVRSIRVAAAGHPSRRERNVEEPTFYFVYRGSLSGGGFEMANASRSGTYRTEVINLHYLMHQQQKGIRKFLSDLLAHARRDESEHRVEFAGESLAELLGGRHYQFEKISTTGRGVASADIYMARPSLKVLRETLSGFEEALGRRDLSVGSFPGIEGIWPTLEGSLERLEVYFADPVSSHLDAFEAYAVAALLRSTWLELQEMAAEIDEEYRDVGEAE